MNGKEKARPDVGASEQAEPEMTACKQSNSLSNFNTVESRKQGYVEGFLLHGAENAIPSTQLVRLTGLSSSRALQKLIEWERRNGALILSRDGSGGGYYLPDEGEKGLQEIAEFVMTNRARAISTLRTIKAANSIVKSRKKSEKV